MFPPPTLLRIEPLEARIAPALTAVTFTWEGDVGPGWDDASGTDKNWIGTPSNNQGIPISGKNLVFPAGAGNKTNTNDIAGLALKKITINDAGYSISGQPITLSGGLTVGGSNAALSTFVVPITLAADQTFTNNSASTTLRLGLVDLGGHELTVSGTHSFIFSSNATKITGAGRITLTGAAVSFSTGNDYTGPTELNAGQLTLFSPTALGASGAANDTIVASGATLSFDSGVTGTVAEDLTLSGTGKAGASGALELLFQTAVGANITHTGALRLGANAKIGNSGTLTLAGSVGGADDALGILTVQTSSVLDAFAFTNAATFTTELGGLTPGTQHDQLAVIGKVNLGGATLNVVPSFTPAIGDKFTIVSNDGAEAVTGTFAGLADDTVFAAGGINFKINYAAGTNNNDVVLTVESFVETPLPVTLSADAKTATFTDRDGDLVTIKTSKGPFQQSDFKLIAAGVAGGGQLQQINLTTHPDDFTGANLTITAKPGPLGGNGFVNVGYINAIFIDLGAVKIAGDLGRIKAGTIGGDVKVAGLKSLEVQSLGLLGTSTQASGGDLRSFFHGAVGKLVVKGDVRDADFLINGEPDGSLGSATIGGSLVATTTGLGFEIKAEAAIGSLKIAGDVRSETTTNLSQIAAGTTLGTLSVGGSFTAALPDFISVLAFGKAVEPTKGLDLAIKSLAVRGSVENVIITAGSSATLDANADAAIGAVTVGGDWIASSVTAGTSSGTDSKTGTEDDVKIPPPFGALPVRDNPAIFSQIGSFTVKGQALGTAGNTSDMFGVVAERIGKAKVGGRTFAFTSGAAPEVFFAAPTLDGAGTENPMFDFTIREIGSTTPTVALGGANLVVNGSTATFTDVDGDLVTVKRSEGTFVAGDFAITTTASGGGQFTKLTLTTAPGNLTITAKPGPQGGNGLVNIGGIEAIGVTVGNVAIAGDLGQFEGGLSADGKPGTAALTTHSIGALGLSTGATSDFSKFTGGLGKLTVTGDVRDVDLESFIAGEKWGAVSISGALIRSILAGEDGIGSVKIGGSFLGSQISGEGPLGAITIGGDLVGDVADGFSIFSFGQLASPAAGLDLAIKSITVKGSVENARVIVGTGFDVNRDASIGAISVGRSWLASSVLVGANVGPDTFAGTSDDTQAIPAGGGDVRDVSTRFSTIASIAIKGQALGSAATGDSFGIVAEQIGKAKIGTLTFKFTKGARNLTDAFAAAPTGPGPAPDNAASDFFIREIV